MTINRIINGESVNIELTAYELRDAYYEQQGIYDREDVISYIDEQYLENHDDISREQLEPLIDDITVRYRYKIENGAFDWWDVAEDAIDYIREGEGI